MLVAAVGLAALVLGVAAGHLFARRSVSRRVARSLAAMDPDRTALPEAGLSTVLERYERLVANGRDQVEARERSLGDLRSALDALAIGVVVADRGGRIVFKSAAASSFLKVHHADVLVDDAVQALIGAALDGRSSRRTLDLYGPPQRSIVVSADPVADDTGAVRAAVATVEDVTERLRLEAVRTDFVANISHELKTPVGALALLAEALQGEDDPELVDRLSQKMVFEAHRVARIIEDLLELSRIELAGPQERTATSVGLLVAEAVERVRSLMHTRDVRVLVDEPSKRMAVYGDRRQVVSAVANLVENAVKYSPAGSEVEVHSRSDGQWVDIEVVDHGLGIPAKDLDRVFERFYRVDRARSRDTGGTGLGLSIVRHVATNHGGTVQVRSQEGAGSTFTLRLPAGAGPVPMPSLRPAS